MAKAKGISKMHARLQGQAPAAIPRAPALTPKETMEAVLEYKATNWLLDPDLKLEHPRDLYRKWQFVILPAWLREELRDTPTSEIESVIRKEVATNGWSLYLDDERTPGIGEGRPSDIITVVARSNHLAQETITKMGSVPAQLHLDYDLSSTSYGNTIEFVEWFIQAANADPKSVPEDFTWRVVSTHHEGRPILKKMMHDWYEAFESKRAQPQCEAQAAVQQAADNLLAPLSS